VSTEEFGFAILDDAFATAARCCPEEESRRGRAGPGQERAPHRQPDGAARDPEGLPLAYNRDLQEDKEPLFDSIDQSKLALAALTGLLTTVTFDGDRMQDAANGSSVAAVDLAEWLVQQGMPFRQAHSVVGGLVHDSLERHVPLAELVEAHPALGGDAVALLEPGVAVTRRTTPAAPAPPRWPCS